MLALMKEKRSLVYQQSMASLAKRPNMGGVDRRWRGLKGNISKIRSKQKTIVQFQKNAGNSWEEAKNTLSPAGVCEKGENEANGSGFARLSCAASLKAGKKERPPQKTEKTFIGSLLIDCAGNGEIAAAALIDVHR